MFEGLYKNVLTSVATKFIAAGVPWLIAMGFLQQNQTNDLIGSLTFLVSLIVSVSATLIFHGKVQAARGGVAISTDGSIIKGE